MRFCEISRVLMPGAPFAFTVHSEFWETSGFPETLERLQEEQQFKMIEKEANPYIAEFPEKTSFFCVADAA